MQQPLFELGTAGKVHHEINRLAVSVPDMAGVKEDVLDDFVYDRDPTVNSDLWTHWLTQ